MVDHHGLRTLMQQKKISIIGHSGGEAESEFDQIY